MPGTRPRAIGGAPPSHRYEFRVISGNVAGESGPSAVVSAMPVPPAPAAPSNLRATAGSGQVALSWNASPTGSVYYWVYYRPQGHSEWYYYAQPAGQSPITVTNLLNGFTYSFKVTAANAAGQTIATNVVTVRPMPPLPAAPGWPSPSADPNSSRIDLSWAPSSSPGVTYRLEYRNLSDAQGVWHSQYTSGVGATFDQYPVGVVWEFRVVATNMTGSSVSSSSTAVSNVWTGTFRTVGWNRTNNANAFAAARILLSNVGCSVGLRQNVCFGWGYEGRPVTYGDYLFYPGTKANLNHLVECEARQRLDLLRSTDNGWFLSRFRGMDLLQHESIHTLQEGGYQSFALFSLMYGLEGTDAEKNQFEINANLRWGHYRAPFGNTRNCGCFT
ncbi:MAG: fibronectin type III domain-containing protein [Umezawaea sp.]